jgi:hypothetical protein
VQVDHQPAVVVDGARRTHLGAATEVLGEGVRDRPEAFVGETGDVSTHRCWPASPLAWRW